MPTVVLEIKTIRRLEIVSVEVVGDPMASRS